MKKIYKNVEVEIYCYGIDVMLASGQLDSNDNFGSVNDFQ